MRIIEFKHMLKEVPEAWCDRCLTENGERHYLIGGEVICEACLEEHWEDYPEVVEKVEEQDADEAREQEQRQAEQRALELEEKRRIEQL